MSEKDIHTMPAIDPALRTHAERLLVGTAVTVDELLAAATGTRPVSTAVEAAVRDGWCAAAPHTSGQGETP